MIKEMLQSLSRRTLTNPDILLLLVLIWTLTQIHFHPRTFLIVTFLLAISQLQTRTLARRCIYLTIRTLNVLFRYLVLLRPYICLHIAILTYYLQIRRSRLGLF